MRHALVRRRLAAHLPVAGHVVDLGCGPGWLAVDLVRDGHHVTAVDADPTMVAVVERRREQLEPARAARLHVVRGRVEDLGDLPLRGGVDVVCCHAVLPFVADHRAVLAAAVGLLRPGGVVSVVAKNATALPIRAGLQGRFVEAIALAEGGDEHDDHGRVLRAHRPDDVVAALEAAGVRVVAHHGVQVVTAHADVPADPAVVSSAVDLEERLGDHDPARLLARQFHLIGVRGAGSAPS